MPQSESTLCLAQCLFEYNPQANEELYLEQGQIIRILEQNDAGWWLGSNTNGCTGWAPSNFLRELSVSEVKNLADTQSLFNTQIENNSKNVKKSDVGAVESEPTPEQTNIDSLSLSEAESTLHSSAAEKLDIPHSQQEQRKTSVIQNINNLEISKSTNECNKCSLPLLESFAQAGQFKFHIECFKCPKCAKNLTELFFVEHDGLLYCEDDYHDLFSPRCAKCNEAIRANYISALGQKWHEEHFSCTVCEKIFDQGRFHKGKNNQPYCDEHYTELFGAQCVKCTEKITGLSLIAGGKRYHQNCFRCAYDDEIIPQGKKFHEHNDKIYCSEHLSENIFDQCISCNELVIGNFVKVLEQTYHPKCFCCQNCKIELMENNFSLLGTTIFCTKCQSVKIAASSPRSALPPTDSKLSESIILDKIESQNILDTENEEIDQEIPDAKNASQEIGDKNNDKEAITDIDSLDIWKERKVYTLAQLQDISHLPDGVTISTRDSFLSDEEFSSLFDMTRDEFSKLKVWKQQEAKRSVGLF